MHYRAVVLSVAIAAGYSVPDAKAQERWQGAYMGLGLTSSTAEAEIVGSTAHRHEKDSASLSFHGGYNFTRPSGFTWGPEVVLSFIGTPGRKTDGALGTSDFKGSFVLSPRARLGYATDRMFFYGLIGLGISDVGPKAAGAGGTDLSVGGALGLGAEVAVTETWSARIEAVGYGFEDDSRVFNGVSRKTESGVGQITLGVSRKF